MAHSLASTFVLGYHGCDRDVAEQVLDGDDLKPSANEYDWLGPGIYFWEANPKRGLDWARELKTLGRGNIKEPDCIGAVIELGFCLDLTTLAGIEAVRQGHRSFVEIQQKSMLPLPKNSKDLLRRNLDCAVIRTVHAIREQAKQPRFDTVRGVFREGRAVYTGGGFYEKTHIQICVCEPERIKGVFRVRKSDLS